MGPELPCGCRVPGKICASHAGAPDDSCADCVGGGEGKVPYYTHFYCQGHHDGKAEAMSRVVAELKAEAAEQTRLGDANITEAWRFRVAAYLLVQASRYEVGNMVSP